jgi:hypothetical protein
MQALRTLHWPAGSESTARSFDAPSLSFAVAIARLKRPFRLLPFFLAACAMHSAAILLVSRWRAWDGPLPIVRARSMVLVAPKEAKTIKLREPEPAVSGNPSSPSAAVAAPLEQGKDHPTEKQGRLRRYFVSRELDERPSPQEEWRLNTRALPRDALSMVSLTLWISEDGHIDRWRVDEQSPPGPWPDDVLAPLGRTTLTPGVVDGTPVPSEMRVEINMDTRLIR